MLRKLFVAAALAASPLLASLPAGALAAGSTVCYTADGTPVVNPPNPDDFESCFTREGTGGSGGSGGPQLCTVDVYSYGSDDGLGSTGPYRVRSCSSVTPLQG